MSSTPTPRYTPFQIKVGDRTYNATWHVEAESVVVSSAYGSAAAPAGRRNPEAVAADVLHKLLARR